MKIPTVALQDCRTSIHEEVVASQIEKFPSKLKVLGLSQVAAICSWSLIPVAPLMAHLGVALFGRETQEQPVWWQVVSSPVLLADLSNRLREG